MVKDVETTGIIREATYFRFIGHLLVSMYVFSSQGRVSGIADMKYQQYFGLIEDGYAMSQSFKTSTTYGYQPVTLAEMSLFLLRLYWEQLRPCIANMVGEDCISANTSLFLRYSGEPFTGILSVKTTNRLAPPSCTTYVSAHHL